MTLSDLWWELRHLPAMDPADAFAMGVLLGMLAVAGAALVLVRMR